MFRKFFSFHTFDNNYFFRHIKHLDLDGKKSTLDSFRTIMSLYISSLPKWHVIFWRTTYLEETI